MPRLELECSAERVLVALLSQQIRLRWKERVEKAFHGGRRLGTDELSHDPPLVKGFDGGYALNPVEPRKSLVGIDVELYELQLAGALGSLALEDRTELQAGRAPGGPEVDHHRQ